MTIYAVRASLALTTITLEKFPLSHKEGGGLSKNGAERHSFPTHSIGHKVDDYEGES